MSGNSFGKIFKITTFGESHGKAVGVVIDGCPAGLKIDREEIQADLDRRKPGQNELTTSRNEADQVKILSGVFGGKTLGTPIALMVNNKDADSKSYEKIKDLYRPGHADYVYEQKYGVRDWRGGGRASARETIARVAAAAVAKKILSNAGIKIVGYVSQIGNEKITQVDESQIEKNILRCPDKNSVAKMSEIIESAKAEEDSVGGVVEVVVRGVPAGLGEPVFDKLSAKLAHGLMSIPATKGVEIGDGFACVDRKGSDNNDELTSINGEIKTKSNKAGGIIGGISNGEDIVARVAFKPVSSIGKEQNTVDKDGQEQKIKVEGRHDPCVCARAVPIVESMVILVLVDSLLLNKISK